MRLRRFADIFRHKFVAVSCHTHKYAYEPAPLCDAKSFANRSCRLNPSFLNGGRPSPPRSRLHFTRSLPEGRFQPGGGPSLPVLKSGYFQRSSRCLVFIPFQYIITAPAMCQGRRCFLPEGGGVSKNSLAAGTLLRYHENQTSADAYCEVPSYGRVRLLSAYEPGPPP